MTETVAVVMSSNLSGAQLRRLLVQCNGNVAMTFAFVLPVLIGVAGLGVDSAAVYNQQARMQSVADSVALAITKEMQLFSDDGLAAEREAGEARVETLLGEVGLADRANSTEITLDPDAGRAQVRISMPAAGYFPFDFWRKHPITVQAEAIVFGQERLCVLGLEESASDTIKADAVALVTAPDCAIHSNSTDPNGLTARQLSTLTASFICSSGGYQGLPTSFSPTPEVDCPRIEDPLSMRDPPPAGGCDYLDFKVDEGVQTIQPGHYCGGLTIVNSTNVLAAPGTYVISGGKLEVADEAQLHGRDVSFYFADAAATLVFKDKAHIELGAPRDGPMAGMLFYEDRAAPPGRSFEITSGSVKELLGTIYLPNGTFKGDGRSVIGTVTNAIGGVTEAIGAGGLLPVIGEASAYTVIVAKRLELIGINLVINADYAGSEVPVPRGLGPYSQKVRLSR